MIPGKNARLKKKGEILPHHSQKFCLTVFCNPVIVEKIIPRHALRENRNKELSVFRILFNKSADGKKLIVNARNLCGGADRRVRIVCPIVVKCIVQKSGDRLTVHGLVKKNRNPDRMLPVSDCSGCGSGSENLFYKLRTSNQSPAFPEDRNRFGFRRASPGRILYGPIGGEAVSGEG